jgi:hypothetical protein
MSRKKFWGYVKNELGRVIPDANIRLYLNGTDNYATIYSTPVSASSDEIDQDTFSANSSGYFEFYVGDMYEFGDKIGYQPDQLFDLRWESPDGEKYGNIDNLQIFYQLFLCDPTDEFDTVKNKLVSNEDAYKWSTHVEETWFHRVHQLDSLDINDYSSATFNKLVSNKLMKDLYDYIPTFLISGGGVNYIETIGSGGMTFLVDAGSWSSESGYYVYTVNHNYGIPNLYPQIEIWNIVGTGYAWGKPEIIYPVRIDYVDDNNLKVYVTTPLDRAIFIAGERITNDDFEVEAPEVMVFSLQTVTPSGVDGIVLELWERLFPLSDSVDQVTKDLNPMDCKSFAYNNEIYVKSNNTKVNFDTLADAGKYIHKYNPSTYTWSTVTTAGPERYLSSFEQINGKIYIHGGYESGFVPENETWSYNISADTWTLLSTAGPAYLFSSYTNNGSDKLYMYSGIDNTYTTNEDLWEYNVNTNTWTLLASTSPLTYNDTLRSLYYSDTDKIYYISSNEMYTFNLSGNNWSASLPFPFTSSVYYHEITSIEGAIYVNGGYNTNTLWNFETYSYDIDLNVWTQLTDLPYGLQGHFVENVGGIIYSGGASSLKNYVLEYDPEGDTFEISNVEIGDNYIPQRISYINFEYNDLLYLLSGLQTRDLDDQWIYNPYTNTSTMLASSSDIKRLWNPSISVLNNKAYVFGGYNTDTSSYSYKLFSYDVLTETWDELANLPTSAGRRAPTSVIYNNKLYVHGGSTGSSTYTNETWLYDISGNTWTLISTAGPTANYMSSVLYDGKMYAYGGRTTGGGYLNNLWSYDVSGSTWTLVSSAGPTNAVSRMILNGDDIFIVGGLQNNSFWQYDISGDSWIQLNSVFDEDLEDLSYWNISSILSNGSIYLYGGQLNSVYLDNIIKNKIEEPATITEVPSVFEETDDAYPVLNFFSFNHDNEMYIYGGKAEEYVGGIAYSLRDTGYVSKYDYINKTWSIISTDGPSRFDFVAGYYNGKLYVHGGRDTSNNYYSDTWSYNISADTWTQVVTGGLSINRSVYASNDEKLYSYGGFLTTTSTHALYEFDMSSNTWSTILTAGDVTFPDWMVYHDDNLYVHSNSSSSFQLYDISGDSWSGELTYHSDTIYYSKAVVYDDKIYMTGGAILTTTLFSNLILSIYDITGDSWSYSSEYLLTESVNSNLIEYNDKLYTYSGGDGNYLSPTYMQVYDVAGDSWSFDNVEKTKAFLKFSGTGNICELINNEAFVFYNDSYNNIWEEAKFNIDTNTSTLITSASSIPRGLYKATTVVGDKIYMFGGSDSSYDDILYEYDTTTYSLSVVSTYTGHGKYSSIMETYDNKLYIHGGFDVAKSQYTYDTIEYDITGDTWTVVSSANGGSTGAFMSSTVSGSNIYTYGGQTNTTELWKFDINTSTWSLLSSTGGPDAFFGHSIYIYNNILYVFGGVSTNKNIWTYNLSTDTWAMLDDVFDKTLLVSGSVIRNNIVFFFNGYYGVVNNDKVLRYKIT